MQIITDTDAGRNNANLAAATSRIIEGGSWKRQRIVVLIPSAAMIPAKVALSHWNLIFPPNQPVVRWLCLGMEVGEAYSAAIQQIVDSPELREWEYILTVESDNCPPSDGVLKLIESMDKHPEYAVISGLYHTKGAGGCPQVWGDVSDPVLNFRPQPPRAGEIVECNGTGMGFALWRIKMFRDEKLRRPWFKTLAGVDGVGTQDLYFAADAKKHGYRFAVDCRVLVGHYDHEGKCGPAETMW